MSKINDRDIVKELENELETYYKNYEVPDGYLRPFEKGNFHGSAIEPQWVIQALTETFGLCGTGWYYEITHRRTEWSGETEARVYVDINLYYKIRNPDGTDEWSKPVQGSGGNILSTTRLDRAQNRAIRVVDDECDKKAITDALGKACQKLGIAGNVYMGNEKTKYSEYEKSPKPKSMKINNVKPDIPNFPPSRDELLETISVGYNDPEYRATLKDFVKSKGKDSHDELDTRDLAEFVSMNGE